MPRARLIRARLRRLARFVQSIALVLVLVALVAGAAAAALLYLEMTAVLPPVGPLAEYRAPAATQVFARDGSLIAEFYREKRYVVPIERIPPVVRRAFVAAEDERFYEHRGIDLASIARAFINNTFDLGSLQGGSTITQQVVKSLLLTPTRSYERKLKEILLAIRLERQLTKDVILALYLNHIYLGSGAYGVAAAAGEYFGKSIEELNLPEAALLAGLPQAPSRYSPVKHWHRAKMRQRYVLRRMLEIGFISPAEHDAATRQPIALAQRRGNYLAAPYYVEHVRRLLEERYGADVLYQAGLRIHTAADVEMTASAEKALRWGLEELHERQGGSRKPVRHLTAEQMAGFLGRQAERPRLRGGQKLEAVVVSIRGGQPVVQGGGAQGALDLGADRKHAASLRIGDVLRVVVSSAAEGGIAFGLDREPEVEGAITAMDPETGHVSVMVGGYDYRRSQFNRVVQAARQPGSAFKPFVYAAALDRNFTPATIVLDAPVAFPDNNGIWMPQNYEEEYYGPTTLREALTHSRNVVTVKVANRIGLPYLIQYLRRVGIESPLGRNLSISLGSAEVSLLELVAGYSVFANQGQRAEPILITRIVDDEGQTIFEAAPRVREAIPAATAYQITSMLQSVVQEGTGRRVKSIGRPVAGKTGTTNDLHDAWFIGYTPQLIAGVWVGFDEKRSLGKRETGGRVASPVWLRFMESALAGLPIVDFPVPSDVALVRIDPLTGLRALPDTPGSVLEAFRRGTEPLTATASTADVAPAAGGGAVRDFFRDGD